MRIVKAALVVVALCGSAFAAVITVGFDEVTAPGSFAEVTPGGPLGPDLTYTFLSLSGGVILNGETGWAGLETSSPNLYGTSDFVQLDDASTLPGTITGTFDFQVDTLGFDLINGYGAGSFSVRVYDATDAMVGSATLGLLAYPGSGAVGSVFFSMPGQIKWFEVTSAQGAGSIDFGIDSLNYSTVVPEPATFALIGLGLIGLGAIRKFRS